MNHVDQVIGLLRTQVSNPAEVDDIYRTASEVMEKWVDPLSGGAASTNGLLYGLVQSGKTGVLTATGALGADQGYRTIIVLTSDIDPLYEQTLGRAQEAFPGMDVLGKKDLRDTASFLQRVRGTTCAIVVTKNASILRSLIENFRQGNLRGLGCLIIDDEADQASLNTRASRGDGSQSTINELIEDIRAFFERNTYLQVTATPQSLFLQDPSHPFRPNFTVLSHPGADYVGGEDFFGDASELVLEFPLQDILTLAPGPQPAPALTIPLSLLRALDTFMVGATFKRTREPDQNCAFLCHVSTKTSDHDHIVRLLRKYKLELTEALRVSDPGVVARLKAAYEELCRTHIPLRSQPFDGLLQAIAFLSPGISVKLVNGQTDEDVAVRSPYNLFVGGNKLGRGVTIKNLLVSYYGRNPRTPQADTVLQHARMYGYRRRDIGLLRLFLPNELHVVFSAINRMEVGLRELIARRPSEAFRGIYVEGAMNPTRRNVLAPGSLGVYTGGSSYNPSQVARDASVANVTAEIDEIVRDIADKSFREVPLDLINQLLSLIRPDSQLSEKVWDSLAVSESALEYAKLANQPNGYVYVDRDRDLQESRRETQGVLSGGEAGLVPQDKITLFLLRTRARPGSEAAWWPQVRFPSGRYALAFAI